VALVDDRGRERPLAQGLHDELGRARELGGRGRLAVAAEGHVVEAPELGGRRGERTVGPQLAGLHLPEQRVELARDHLEVHRAPGAGDGAVDAAVDAAEGALLARREVDADGQAARAPADHRVDEPVVAPEAAVLREERGWTTTWKGTNAQAGLNCGPAPVAPVGSCLLQVHLA
jgi:hypothetical protein